MSAEESLAVFRGVERLLIEAGGITAIVLGTWLYLRGVAGPQAGETHGPGFAFKLRNAAPGSVLALFGMLVLVAGLTNPLKIGVTQELDSLGRQSKVSANKAAEVLAAHVAEADRLLSEAERSNDKPLPEPVAALLNQVRDARNAPDPSAALQRLACEAWGLKAERSVRSRP